MEDMLYIQARQPLLLWLTPDMREDPKLQGF